MKLQSVQILRGLAAILVLLFHLFGIRQQGIVESGGAVPIGGLVANGFAGVDLFFVISGFIMVYVTQGVVGGPSRAASFLFARTTRIYPLWWMCSLVLGGYFVAVYGLPSNSAEWQTVIGNENSTAYFVKSFLLVPQPAYPLPAVGWTLIHELYFYLAFALMLAIMPRALWPMVLMGWAVGVVVGTSLGLTDPIAVDAIGIVCHPMTLEFIIGAFGGLLIVSSVHWRPGLLAVIAALWLAAALCMQGAVTNQTLLWARVLQFGIPSALLVYSVAALDLQARIVWLLPAGVGFVVTALTFLAYGVQPTEAFSARASATIVSLCVGLLAVLAAFWTGWLAGQAAPERLMVIAVPLRRAHAHLASLGEWSYSLYLTHIIVLSVVRMAFEALGRIELVAPVFRIGHDGPWDDAAFIVTGILLALTAAKLTYTLFEQPAISAFGQIRTRLFGPRRQAAPAE